MSHGPIVLDVVQGVDEISLISRTGAPGGHEPGLVDFRLRRCLISESRGAAPRPPKTQSVSFEP